MRPWTFLIFFLKFFLISPFLSWNFIAPGSTRRRTLFAHRRGALFNVSIQPHCSASSPNIFSKQKQPQQSPLPSKRYSKRHRCTRVMTIGAPLVQGRHTHTHTGKHLTKKSRRLASQKTPHINLATQQFVSNSIISIACPQA